MSSVMSCLAAEPEHALENQEAKQIDGSKPVHDDSLCEKGSESSEGIVKDVSSFVNAAITKRADVESLKNVVVQAMKKGDISKCLEGSGISIADVCTLMHHEKIKSDMSGNLILRDPSLPGLRFEKGQTPSRIANKQTRYRNMWTVIDEKTGQAVGMLNGGKDSSGMISSADLYKNNDTYSVDKRADSATEITVKNIGYKVEKFNLKENPQFKQLFSTQSPELSCAGLLSNPADVLKMLIASNQWSPKDGVLKADYLGAAAEGFQFGVRGTATGIRSVAKGSVEGVTFLAKLTYDKEAQKAFGMLLDKLGASSKAAANSCIKEHPMFFVQCLEMKVGKSVANKVSAAVKQCLSDGLGEELSICLGKFAGAVGIGVATGSVGAFGEGLAGVGAVTTGTTAVSTSLATKALTVTGRTAQVTAELANPLPVSVGSGGKKALENVAVKTSEEAAATAEKLGAKTEVVGHAEGPAKAASPPPVEGANTPHVENAPAPMLVTQEQLTAAIPASEKPWREWFSKIQEEVTALRSKNASPSAAIVEISNQTVEEIRLRLAKVGTQTKIVEILMEGGLKRKALQITGGEGSLGRLGQRMSSSDLYSHNTLLYDPYPQFMKQQSGAAMHVTKSLASGYDNIPGIRLNHSHVVPNAMATEGLYHEAGHMVEEAMRNKGVDSGLLGSVRRKLSTDPALPVSGYENGMAMGENRQYTTSMTQAYKEMKKQLKIANDLSTSPEAASAARLAAERARLVVELRHGQLKEVNDFSMATNNRAIDSLKKATDRDVLAWTSQDAYYEPMKNHFPVEVPISNATGSVTHFLSVYVPDAARGNANAMKAAIQSALEKTKQKLVGIKQTMSKVGPEVHPVAEVTKAPQVEIGYKADGTPYNNLPNRWAPQVGEAVAYRRGKYSFDAQVERVSGNEIFVRWTSPTSQKPMSGVIDRISGQLRTLGAN